MRALEVSSVTCVNVNEVKMSEFKKKKATVLRLKDISEGFNPGDWAQVSLLGKYGYITIKAGRKLELTDKGRKLAALYSDNPETFDENIRKLLNERLEREPFVPGTMLLFYADCAMCNSQKLIHKAWVLEDCKAIKDGSPRTAPPVLEKHIH